MSTATKVNRLGSDWRIGKTVQINIYEGDRPICQCHTVTDAKRIVAAVNTFSDLFDELDHLAAALEDGDTIHIEPGSVTAEHIKAVIRKAKGETA